MRKALVRMMLLTALILFAGCATLPQPAEMQADIADFALPKSPEEGKALVYVVRPSVMGSLIRFVGATDAIGLRAVESPHHLRDIHTTILHQLGLDQDRLSYLHVGRRERLTLVHGNVIEDIV